MHQVRRAAWLMLLVVGIDSVCVGPSFGQPAPVDVEAKANLLFQQAKTARARKSNTPLEKQRFIVLKKTPNVQSSALVAKMATANVQALQEFKSSTAVAIEVSAEELKAALQADPDVQILPDIPVEIRNLPEQFPLSMTSLLTVQEQPNVQRIGAPTIWAHPKGTRGQNVVVAVIDSGADMRNPRLTPAVLTTNTVAYNFVRPQQGSFERLTTVPPNFDEFGHGTHVSGIIAGADGFGVAPGAKILPIRVFEPNGGGGADALPSDIVRAIEVATDDGRVDIINISAGTTIDPGISKMFDDAIARAESKGILVVCAAGNTDSFLATPLPAAIKRRNTIAVGMVDGGDQFDARGTPGTTDDSIDISAPGVAIRSTWPLNLQSPQGTPGVASETGTSMATPHVAGAAALVLSVKKAVSGASALTQQQRLEVRQLLLDTTARAIGGVRLVGRGRVDVAAAFAKFIGEPAQSGTPSQPVTPSPDNASLSQLSQFNNSADQTITRLESQWGLEPSNAKWKAWQDARRARSQAQALSVAQTQAFSNRQLVAQAQNLQDDAASPSTTSPANQVIVLQAVAPTPFTFGWNPFVPISNVQSLSAGPPAAFQSISPSATLLSFSPAVTWARPWYFVPASPLSAPAPASLLSTTGPATLLSAPGAPIGGFGIRKIKVKYNRR